MLGDINVTSLARIDTGGGDVMHALKVHESDYVGFGEAYFSCVDGGVIKAWKKHTRMMMNLIVAVGNVRFVFFDASSNKFREEIIGVDRYLRLCVPPGVWFGFQGLSFPQSLVLNIANMEHDPEEVERQEISRIQYDWS
jgi:dTDP-4-dehydrorhamnose 3,5-epimerase